MPVSCPPLRRQGNLQRAVEVSRGDGVGAEQFGLSIMDLGSLAQIAGAMGRSMSPIAGAAIICAGLAKVNPIEVSKRNALPCLVSAIVLMLLL